jgi:glycosyltransferase involved in cell wall biosynthesis
VWAPHRTLEQLPERPWLRRDPQESLNAGQLDRFIWRHQRLPRAAAGCDLLFVPGGGYTGQSHSYATMSRNLLPFEPAELARYSATPVGLRLRWLRYMQIRSFRRAGGVIFLNEYAQRVVTRWTGPIRGMTAIIPHGIDATFLTPPRLQRPIASYDQSHPFRFLYVSIVDLYKHQRVVAEAVASLRAEGLPIAVDFVGPAYRPALATLQKTVRRLDPAGTSLRYLGPASFSELPKIYREADAFVFASSCENMPNILIEAMASGLPIACSSRGPMPEVLQSAGMYFDPLNPISMRDALRRLANNEHERAILAAAAYNQAQRYSWSRCAAETFAFLRQVAMNGESALTAQQ